MTDASRPTDDDGATPRSDGVPPPDLAASFDERQPESQGSSPLDAELGEDGQGDILAEDEPATSDDDAPDDLRVEDLP
ncbi:hypothetical protein [Microbacterium allomyrinae]|uniref:Sugar ABC transporter ATPase n=1 Tax=Microbacterium allomyrinae TaxID=2830666 RepID=A0A9X1LWI7_9MICO|nr:hypothetical protein [Microbacterium allomyrinae]MCC2033167.1 hypothetical protein [Microbacterium allomyrinae]